MPLAWCYETGEGDRDNGHHRCNLLGHMHSILRRCYSLRSSMDPRPNPTAYMVRGNPKERGKAETSG